MAHLNREASRRQRLRRRRHLLFRLLLRWRLLLRAAPNVEDVHDRFANAVDVAAWWINLWADSALRPQIKQALDNTARTEENSLSWTGTGSLLELTVIRKSDPNTPLEAVGIMGDVALVVGHGSSPEEALVDDRSRGSWTARIPEGWQVDEVMSCYAWLERRPNGTWQMSAVPRGTVLELKRKVSENWPAYYLQYFQKRSNDYQVWKQVAANAQARLHDQAAKDAIAQSLKTVDESRKRVAAINQKLQSALEKAESGARAAVIIKSLQGILTVAQLASKASELLGENPSRFSDATSASGVVDKVDQIEGDRHQVTIQMQADFQGSRTDLQKFLDQLWQQVKATNPPSPVKDSFQLPTPP